MVFHECNCRKLLTELFQHDHALEQCDVVNARKGKQAVSQFKILSLHQVLVNFLDKKHVKHGLT